MPVIETPWPFFWFKRNRHGAQVHENRVEQKPPQKTKKTHHRHLVGLRLAATRDPRRRSLEIGRPSRRPRNQPARVVRHVDRRPYRRCLPSRTPQARLISASLPRNAALSLSLSLSPIIANEASSSAGPIGRQRHPARVAGPSSWSIASDRRLNFQRLDCLRMPLPATRSSSTDRTVDRRRPTSIPLHLAIVSSCKCNRDKQRNNGLSMDTEHALD